MILLDTITGEFTGTPSKTIVYMEDGTVITTVFEKEE